jgi:hypothetical protein
MRRLDLQSKLQFCLCQVFPIDEQNHLPLRVHIIYGSVLPVPPNPIPGGG